MTKRQIAAASTALVIAVITGFLIHSLIRLDSTPPWGNTSTSLPPSPTSAAPHTAKAKPIPFTFLTFNVKNWLNSVQTPPKSPESKKALIDILATSKPDVLGLCEIGSLADVREIQTMLAQAGTSLPHIHHTGGADRVRHLALLSRFPILSTTQPDLKIPGKNYSMQRGILDATLLIGPEKIRFIGLHLKSKRNVPDYNQALVRIDEAEHARKHIDSIFATTPHLPLLVYGDFNDTPRSQSTRTISGAFRSPTYLQPVRPKDSRGESWTHHWADDDLYSRIDFVTLSPTLTRRLDKAATRILDPPDWEKASDHRALLIRFK